MDSPTPTSSPSSSSPSAADQARIRRERRQAKLKKDGGSRLSKITSTQSTSKLYEAASGTEASPSASVTSLTSGSPSTGDVTGTGTASKHRDQAHADDPPDITLSEHYYQPPSTTRPQNRNVSTTPSNYNDSIPGLDEAQMKEIMARMGDPGVGQQGFPGVSNGGVNNPMLGLLQQVMGMPPVGGEAGGEALPQQQVQMPEGSTGDKWGTWWKVVHTIGALLLAIFSLKAAGLDAGYDGSLAWRGVASVEASNFFYFFATMELILQSSRFIVEKGRPPSGSILATIGQALPPKIGKYLVTIVRYSVIWSTVLNDAFLIVFVYGMVAWWNSCGDSKAGTCSAPPI